MPSLRDRLLFVFTELAGYGIAVRPALNATPDEGRAALADELLRDFPDGVGSSVFGTHHDDQHFGPAGDRAGRLELHCRDLPTLRAVDAAGRQADIHCYSLHAGDGPSLEAGPAPPSPQTRTPATRTA